MIDPDIYADHRLDDDGAPPRPTISYLVLCWDHADLKRANPGSGVSNALRFATRSEAEAYGRDLYSRWMGLAKWEVASCDEPVSYRWVDSISRAVPVERLEWACLACHRFWPYDVDLEEPVLFCPECGQQPVLRERQS